MVAALLAGVIRSSAPRRTRVGQLMNGQQIPCVVTCAHLEVSAPVGGAHGGVSK